MIEWLICKTCGKQFSRLSALRECEGCDPPVKENKPKEKSVVRREEKKNPPNYQDTH